MLPNSTLAALLALVGLAGAQGPANAPAADLVSGARWARAQGFRAQLHRLPLDGTHQLELMRLLNPLLPGPDPRRPPLLVVHGEYVGSAPFLLNHQRPEPRDWRAVDICQPQQVRRLLAQPRSGAGQLAYLASNLAWDVWLVNRRGSPASLCPLRGDRSCAYRNASQPIGDVQQQPPADGSSEPLAELSHLLAAYSRESLRPQYWDYSMDEQARLDLPRAVDYVLNVTGHSKLNYVGWSSGSALAMMSLLVQPRLADQVELSVHWAPSIYQGRSTEPAKFKTAAALPALLNYSGPYAPARLGARPQQLLQLACNQSFGAANCAPKQQPGPHFKYANNQQASDLFDTVSGLPVSARQAAQLAQQRQRPKMHYSDLGSPEANQAAYSQAQPPLYDLRRLPDSHRMLLFLGRHDTTVTQAEARILVEDLRAAGLPLTVVELGDDSELYFDHKSFVLHDLVAELLVVPSLQAINKCAPMSN